jgi:hypothetical protein
MKDQTWQRQQGAKEGGEELSRKKYSRAKPCTRSQSTKFIKKDLTRSSQFSSGKFRRTAL